MRRAARPLSTNRMRQLETGSDAGVRRRPAWQRTKSHSHARHSAGESHLYGGAPGAALHCLRLLFDAATLRTEPAPLAGVGAGHREPREDDLLRSLPRICRIAGASERDGLVPCPASVSESRGGRGRRCSSTCKRASAPVRKPYDRCESALRTLCGAHPIPATCLTGGRNSKAARACGVSRPPS